MIDISDGLLADLGHVCETSGVSARIELEALPLSAAARAIIDREPDLRASLAAGGDDYELLFTAAERIQRNRAIVGGTALADYAGRPD
jgi:thiamine-monophosphate kinase